MKKRDGIFAAPLFFTPKPPNPLKGENFALSGYFNRKNFALSGYFY